MRLFGILGRQKTNTPSSSSKGWRDRWLRWPSITIDLSRPKHRRKLFFVFVALNLVGLVVLLGSYQSIIYTESAEFCGTYCHPMKSEFVRYERSPHAKVACAQCHVGEGLSYFAQSKIFGVKSLYQALTNTYDRPLKSPVHDLRPARETCEECHSPTGFTDNIIKTITHYDADEANTLVQSTIILKMGGWQENTGVSEGIHWHITNPVYFITADEQRQGILWVGAEQEDGSLKEYWARDMLNMARTSFVEDARANDELRMMDCIDCHNRTAHFVPSPEVTVDEAISAGLISTDLPYIRTKAVELLSVAYTNTSDAYEAIDGLVDYYSVGNPGIPAEHEVDLDDAITELKKIYSDTNFPDMKLDWRANPDNERHSPFPGCFRCHDGKHSTVDAAGNQADIISVKCNLCHTVPIIGRGADVLIEAPVIAGAVPASHSDFRFTIEHRSTSEAERQECYTCHGQGFCSNDACHSISHPPDMLYTHPDEYRKIGSQVCYTCHQDVLCSRCHAGGIIVNP
ncbi:MAG: hypothetical protein GY832_23905 [Chloroflexi bacterium]|nr:hypothetical protein [Chloroflexota bacterium]